MTKIIFAVFLGGGFGSLMRFAVQALFHRSITPILFPWATLTVNVAGSFLIGLFYALSARLHLSEETRLFLTTGLCGGFTTFSTFSHENLALLRQGAYGAFALYATLSVVTGPEAGQARRLWGNDSCNNGRNDNYPSRPVHTVFQCRQDGQGNACPCCGRLRRSRCAPSSSKPPCRRPATG